MNPMLAVGTSFFWTMLFIAFAMGWGCQRFVTRDDRRRAREDLAEAAALLSDIAHHARALEWPIPAALRRRLIRVRDRFAS